MTTFENSSSGSGCLSDNRCITYTRMADWSTRIRLYKLFSVLQAVIRTMPRTGRSTIYLRIERNAAGPSTYNDH